MTQILLTTLRTQNQLLVESCVSCWMCKKQTSACHSSTKSEIILLEIGKCHVHRTVPKTQTNPAAGHFSRNHKSNPNKRETEMYSSQGSLSYTFLKSMMQRSKWSLRTEILRWDTCQKPTELLLIGCSTKSIWIPKFKSNSLTPKKQITDMPTKESFIRDEWDRSSTWWTLWISRCFFAAIPQRESRVSCPKKLRKVLLKKVRQWRNRDQRIWCQGTSQVSRKILQKIWMIRTVWWIKNWIRVVFHPAARNWRETST